MSALVPTQDSTGADDGYLRTGEILYLDLKADFVNLSACETGLIQLYGGEGVVGRCIGLQHAMDWGSPAQS